MNEATVEFEAACPCCGKPSVWTSKQAGIYPDIHSWVSRINHERKT